MISKGRNEQALKTLAYYHADGDEDNSLVKYEFEEIKAAIEFDRQVAENVGWKSFFVTAGNRKRLRIIIALAFFSQWSGNGLVSYYLNQVFDSIGITNPTIQVSFRRYRQLPQANDLTYISHSQLLINGILQIWNLFWAVLASTLCDKLGRRFLFLASAGGMALFFTLQTVCSSLFAQHGSPQAAHAVIAFIFLFYASYE